MPRAHVFVVALLLGVTSAALSQPSRAAQLRLQHARVDTITAHWQRAVTLLQAYDDSVARSRARLDTIRAGSLRVLVAPAIRSRVEAFVAVTAAQLDSQVGPAAQRLAKQWLVVRQRWDTTADTVVISAVMPPGPRGFPKSREVEALWGALSDSLVIRGLRHASLSQLSTEVNGGFLRWLSSDVSPDTVSTYAWTQLRLGLVSSATAVARRCYDGDLIACRMTLRLVPVLDAATELFDAAGRRRFVTEGNYSPDAIEVACRDGDDAACLTAARQLVRRGNPISPTRLMVMTATQTALRIGGREAYERLIRSTGAPAQALADAAGVPLDSVLKVWQHNLRETRLPSQDISLGIAASSLLWIAVCGALSLRSSRWR